MPNNNNIVILPDSFCTPNNKSLKDLAKKPNNIDNLSLRFNKVIGYRNNSEGKFEIVKWGMRFFNEYNEKKYKDKDTEEVACVKKQHYKLPEQLLNYPRNLNQQLKNSGYELGETVAVLESSLAIGHGIESVYETALCLHHTYGVPYIPGSSVKGVMRHNVIENIHGGNEDTANGCEIFKALFGRDVPDGEAGGIKGRVIFFDAFPQGADLKVVLDILTPHYPKYYSGEKAPTDDQNPRPVYFPVLPAGTEFCFYIAVKKKHDLDQGGGKTLAELAGELLEKTLQTRAFGAKGQVGYGRFKIIE